MVGRHVGARQPRHVDHPFTPVEDLTPEVQQTIDAALDRGELIGAIKHYRAATGAGLAESKAAVETRRWKRGG